MTRTMVASSEEAPVSSPDGEQYLRSLASCGDKRALVVSQPIYTANGIKLLDTGAKIDSRILDRLFGHQLAKPIDRCVTSEDAVGHKDMVERCRELVAGFPLLSHFDAHLGPASPRLWQALGSCPLPPAIAIRLTVVRDTAAALYDHSLRCAFLALFIGICGRLTERDLQLLAAAALLHDIGMMHANPEHYEVGKTLDVVGRRNLLAHPLTAQLVVQRELLFSPAIAAAVVQHHERLDGSGYPKRLQGEAIGKLGRALMLAEAALGVIERWGEQAAMQLSLLLRVNHLSFDAQLREGIFAALPRVKADDCSAVEVCSEFEQIVALIDSWRHMREAISGSAQDPAAEFIDARIARLRRWLADAGFGDSQAIAMVATEDTKICAEIVAVVREAMWHTRQIAYEALERWPLLEREVDVGASSAARRWIGSALHGSNRSE